MNRVAASSSHRRGNVHEALRRATASAHRALDHNWRMQRLTAPDLTSEQYTESLAAMYRPHSRLERLVHESPHYFESGLELSRRRQLLESDLLELGWPAPALPQTSPGASDGPAAWWGRIYVLEGSRLGSAAIARCIHSSLGDTVPCRFFGEAKAADEYSTLLARLELELADHDALEQAEASARAAFAAYQSELEAFPSAPGS